MRHAMLVVNVCEACGALVPNDVLTWGRHREFHRRTDGASPEGFQTRQI